MPRRNRNQQRLQHPKKLRLGGRPKNWHRGHQAPNVQRAAAWLLANPNEGGAS
jgi:hypothetical protein